MRGVPERWGTSGGARRRELLPRRGRRRAQPKPGTAGSSSRPAPGTRWLSCASPSRSTCATSSRRSACRRSWCTAGRPRLPRRERRATWRSTSAGAPLRRAPGDDHVPWVRRCASDRGRRDPAVPHRRARAASSPTGCSRRCCSPTSSARPSRRRELGDRRWRELLDAHHSAVRRRARALSRPRDRHRRRRLPRRASTGRRGRSAAPARRWRRSRDSGSKSAPASTPASARCIGDKLGGDRRAHRRPRSRPGRPRRGAGLEHGEGSRRRLWPRVRGSRLGRAQGSAGRVALYAVSGEA